MDYLTDFERKQNACSLHSTKMPQTSSHLSRKRLTCRQKLAKKKKLGDMAMNDMAFDVPLVEELMKAFWLNL